MLPVKTTTPLVMRIGLHDEGLVLLTPEIPGEPSEAVRRERGGNGFKRIRGFAHSGDSFRRSRFRRASGGPIFSVLPEKMGEKRGAGFRLVQDSERSKICRVRIPSGPPAQGRGAPAPVLHRKSRGRQSRRPLQADNLAARSAVRAGCGAADGFDVFGVQVRADLVVPDLIPCAVVRLV